MTRTQLKEREKQLADEKRKQDQHDDDIKKLKQE